MNTTPGIWHKITLMKKAATTAVSLNHGLRNAVVQTLSVFRQEGFGGVWQRLLQMTDALKGALPADDGVYRHDYAEWVRRYDTTGDDDRVHMKRLAEGMREQPLISVVMPVYNPRPEWLAEAIESVQKQLYGNWQLCMADDASTDPEVRRVLTTYADQDPRIRVVFLEENLNISACSNEAIGLATGDWISLLDHDDLLPEHALLHVALAVNRHPEARLIYSDEDKIDEKGRRSQPYFKSDWNRELFYSQNMISHLGVYRADVVRQAGCFRIGFEGSQDYDLALRCVELIEDSQICHIPKVLYHWRLHRSSTALASDAKPYAMMAGECALNEHFSRCGVKASARYIGYGYRVRHELHEPLPLVSVIILTRNRVDLLQRCIRSIRERTLYPAFEIIVIDNGSDDPATLAWLNRPDGAGKGFRVTRIDGPFNFSAFNNQAVREAKGSYVALLNNDVEVTSAEWLTEMMGLAVQPGVGAVGARLLYPDGKVQHAGIVLGLGADRVAGCAYNRARGSNRGYFGRAALAGCFSAVTAACMVVRRDLYLEVNGFDEINLPVAYNDVDFCLRLQEAGYHNVFTPFAVLNHHESASRGLDITDEEMARASAEKDYFRARWLPLLADDPMYNPNLTLDFSDFSLAWPPRGEKIS